MKENGRSEAPKWVMPIFLFFVSSGCYFEEPQETASSMPENDVQLEVEKILQARGFDASDTVLLDDGTALAQGDIAFDIDHLLNQDTPITKGYYVTQYGYPPSEYPLPSDAAIGVRVWEIRRIYLYFDSSLSNAWAWAFWLAAAEWNQKTGVGFQLFSRPPSNFWNTIIIEKKDMTDGNGNCVEHSPAMADFPEDGMPGRHVRVNACFDNPDGNCGRADNIEAVSFFSMVAIALHELGHALGFTHPEDSYALLIPGTAAEEGSYSTVMSSQCLSSLSADDIRSATYIWDMTRDFFGY